MKTIESDARRFAWCRSHALWIVGISAPTYLEDARGAHEAGQNSLLRFIARTLGDACAVALSVGLNHDRPVPSQVMRSSWALERLEGHSLWGPCWELIRGVDDLPGEEIVERCETLVAQVGALVGDMPNPLAPEGYYPAVALARDWIKLAGLVGEEPPLPNNWTLPI